MTQQFKIKKFNSSVIAAFLNTTWAIDPTWLDKAWAVLNGENLSFDASEHEQSVLGGLAGERPQGTRYTVIPSNSRVAIIEIWGAIMPRANWITEYSGGTSSELLVRDIKAAAANNFIDEVQFIVHSPGGDIVGVTEVNDAILELNKTKKTTAYIKGNCASAAYWITSAVQRIVANRTAQVGSIGVYTCYRDYTKAMEMVGVRDIIITSEQSPDKNPDPSTEHGFELVKVRVTDLCDEFILDISKNLKVSVETVQENFGKGDMMVAKKAKKVGMVHAIGTFDEAIAQIAETDGSDTAPDDSCAPEDEANSADSTINNSSALNSSSTAETTLNSANNQNLNNGELMKDKEKKNAEENIETANAVDESAAPAAKDNPDPSAKPAEPAAQQSSGETVITAAEYTSMKAEIASLKAENLKTDLTAIAGKFAGKTDDHVALLTDLSSAFGRDSAQVKNYITQQTALTAQLEESALFGESGKTGATGNDSSPLAQLNAKAAEIITRDKTTKAKAFSTACSENPALYDAYTAREGK
ncbi:MAG: S49 family peptidase [Pyrinomonadaceae bacterium]